MIHKWAWGIALILIGLPLVGISFVYLTLLTGVALIVAGVAYIAGK